MEKKKDILLQVLVQRELANKLDELARENYYSTRASFIKHVLIDYVNEASKKDAGEK